METLIFKFLLGGAFVVLFSLLAGFLEPKKLSGVFSAAPSIALANLGIVLIANGPRAVQDQAAGMIAGAIALGIYAFLAVPLIRRTNSLAGSLANIALWLLVALVGYAVLVSAT